MKNIYGTEILFAAGVALPHWPKTRWVVVTSYPTSSYNKIPYFEGVNEEFEIHEYFLNMPWVVKFPGIKKLNPDSSLTLSFLPEELID